MRFRLDTATVTVQDTKQGMVRAVMGDECDVTAGQMLAAEAELKTDEKPIDKAMKWLRGFLSEGPKAQTAVETSAENAGHSWRTIERASGPKEMAIVKKNMGPGRGYLWALPEDDTLGF